MKVIDRMQEFKNGIGLKMLISMFFMPINTLISLIYTRLLLQFLGENIYGIWITISSLTHWIIYFDVGIGNGMRNELAKEIANKNEKSAKIISSTAYYIISIIALVIMVLFIGIIAGVDTDLFFKTDISTKPIIIITTAFVCINFVLSLCKSQLYAEQRAEIVALMNALVQFLQLIALIVAAIFFKENLLVVAMISGLSSAVINILFSIILWKKRSYCRPSLNHVNMKYTKKIGNLGIRFFILQIGCLIMYSTDNMIITRLFGPSDVTSYNMVYKVFNLVLAAFYAFVSPLWSNITVEANRKNYERIQKIIKDLTVLVILICLGILFLTVIFRDLSGWWLGKDLYYERGLILSMGVFIALNTYSCIFSTVLNGMGELNIQLVVSAFTSVLNIPLSVFLATTGGLGVTGVITASNICMIISVVSSVIQTRFVLKKYIKARDAQQGICCDNGNREENL